MTRLGKTVLLLTAALVPIGAAQAQSWRYRVAANSETTYNLQLCDAVVDVRATGDRDTDLDFWLYDPYGSLIHEDTDGTDWTRTTVYRDGDECETYELVVANLGRVYNLMRLSLYGR